MRLTFNRFLITGLISIFLTFAACGTVKAVATEKSLGLANVIMTCYALGGDTGGRKASEEAIYVSKGGPGEGLLTLKEIIIEGKKPPLSFKMKDQIEVIVFRGVFTTLSKVEVKKVILKDSEIEIYAEYTDFPDCDIASQPAAIIPVGQLPPGKYNVALFVDNKLRKKLEFGVSR